MDGSEVRFYSIFFVFPPLPPLTHTQTLPVSASVSQESKQQILQPLSVLRPKFRVNDNIATSHLRAHLELITPGRCSIASRPRTIHLSISGFPAFF